MLKTGRTIFPQPPKVNEIHGRHFGFNAIIETVAGTLSCQRGYMAVSQLSASVVLRKPELPYVVTGYDRKCAPATYKIKSPRHMVQVQAIFHKYTPRHGFKPADNPLTIIFYKGPNNTLGHIAIEHFCQNDPRFGFVYAKNNAVLGSLKVGDHLPAETVLAQSPSITPDGNYAYGKNAWVVCGSFPEITNDGVMISQSWADSVNYDTFRQMSFGYGSDRVPKNLHGTLNDPKIFPELGSYINNTEPVAAFWDVRDPLLAPLYCDPKSLMRADLPGDIPFYSNTRAKIIDVDVIISPQYRIDEIQDRQAVRYSEARQHFYSEILRFYDNIRSAHRGNIVLEHSTDILIREAIAATPNLRLPFLQGLDTPPTKGGIAAARRCDLTMEQRCAPLEPVTIVLTLQTPMKLETGGKLADLCASKAVACHIVSDDRMPYDPVTGRRADIAMSDTSVVDRMNPEREHSRRMNVAVVDMSEELRRAVGLTNRQAESMDLTLIESRVRGLPDETLSHLWDRLMKLYYIMAPHMVVDIFAHRDDHNSTVRHLAFACKHYCRIVSPMETQVIPDDMQRQLDEHFPTHVGPVTFRNPLGEMVQTKGSIAIFPQYMFIIDKPADDPAAVGAASIQEHGLAAPLSKEMRNAAPIRHQPPRANAEAEFRLQAGNANLLALEMQDRNTSPRSFRKLADSIFEAEDPSEIVNAVPRQGPGSVSYGHSAPLNIFEQYNLAMGVGMRFETSGAMWDEKSIAEAIANRPDGSLLPEALLVDRERPDEGDDMAEPIPGDVETDDDDGMPQPTPVDDVDGDNE